MDRPKQYIDEVRWLPCKNVSGETCPPFAVVRLSEFNVTDGYWEIEKPDTDSQAYRLAHNGPVAIANNEFGQVTRDYPLWGVPDSGSPAEGETWGTESGSWHLHNDQTGFIVLCASDSELDAVQIDYYPEDPCCGMGQATISCNSQTFPEVLYLTITGDCPFTGTYPVTFSEYQSGCQTTYGRGCIFRSSNAIVSVPHTVFGPNGYPCVGSGAPTYTESDYVGVIIGIGSSGGSCAGHIVRTNTTSPYAVVDYCTFNFTWDYGTNTATFIAAICYDGTGTPVSCTFSADLTD